jgi:dCTP deaminase
MILNDVQIRTRCNRGLVTPFDDALVNPASIDVRLGDEIIVESVEQKRGVPMPLYHYDESDPYELKPGQFALLSTLETFDIPEDLSGIFRLKSSLAREGLALCGAEFADPGWHNSVATLGVKNFRQFHPILLWPGRPFAQLILHDTMPPERDYAVTGRYNNCLAPVESWDAVA